jgi:type IV secretory pathway TrbF-like protein
VKVENVHIVHRHIITVVAMVSVHNVRVSMQRMENSATIVRVLTTIIPKVANNVRSVHVQVATTAKADIQASVHNVRATMQKAVNSVRSVHVQVAIMQKEVTQMTVHSDHVSIRMASNQETRE